MKYAITATTMTVPRLIHISVLSLAFLLNSLNMSLVTEEAVTSSWESAVDMIAARIAARTIPAIRPGSRFPLRNMNIFSESSVPPVPRCINLSSISSLPAECRKM